MGSQTWLRRKAQRSQELWKVSFLQALRMFYQRIQSVFKYHLYVDNFQMCIYSRDFSPELQTHVCNSVFNNFS